MNLKNYLEQHQAIAVELETIKTLVSEGDIEKNASSIALHINTLAGKLKIHLSMEDKYMYPGLEKNDDEMIKKLAERYQSEMGDLSDKFTEYKEKFNTKPKILKYENELRMETNKIFHAIEQRVHREENELYLYIK